VDLKMFSHVLRLNFFVVNLWGRGASSVVYECREKSTGTRYAVKVYNNKSHSSLAVLQRESIILTKVDHKNVIKCFGLFTDYEGKVYAVLELVDGGELHGIVDELGALSERDGQAVGHQLLMALLQLHNHNILHRDIKPENVLLTVHGILKLADFGFAIQTHPYDPTVMGCVGSPSYQAPEILLGIPYTKAVDMWSFGVTIYAILTSTKPFPNTGKDRTTQLSKILNADYNFNGKEWVHISSDAKDFISQLLKVKPTDRMTAEDAVRHPWMAGPINLKLFGERWESKVQLRNQSKKRKKALKFAIDSIQRDPVVHVSRARDHNAYLSDRDCRSPSPGYRDDYSDRNSHTTCSRSPPEPIICRTRGYSDADQKRSTPTQTRQSSDTEKYRSSEIRNPKISENIEARVGRTHDYEKRRANYDRKLSEKVLERDRNKSPGPERGEGRERRGTSAGRNSCMKPSRSSPSLTSKLTPAMNHRYRNLKKV